MQCADGERKNKSQSLKKHKNCKLISKVRCTQSRFCGHAMLETLWKTRR